MKAFSRWLTAAYLFVLLTPVYVYAGTNIGTTSSPFFTKIVRAGQALVDFFEGPFALIFVVIGSILAIVIWVAAPKSGAVGLLGRAVVGGIVILDIPALISLYKNGV
jgi:hypothetical protein